MNWLLVGSLGLTLVALINVSFSFLALRDKYLLVRLALIALVLLFFGALLGLSRRTKRHFLASLALVGLFFLAAMSVVYSWGIINPVGILLFSLAIVMSGILMGARYSLYTALLTSLVLSLLEYAKAHHRLLPNTAWEKRPSSFTDVVSFTAIFAIIALVSWLFNRQMEKALRRAKRSERALRRQRDLLEVKVEERTRELQAAQLQQVQEFYRFAELGHLSTALFHDLANHLMSVSVDIEGLQKHKRSVIMARIQDNIHYIEEVVRRVRQQMKGQDEIERFNVINEIQEVIKMLNYQSNRSQVSIILQPAQGRLPITYRGNLIRFRQIIINLLSNAIEAYPTVRGAAKSQRLVTVAVARQQSALVVSVNDRGQGIGAVTRHKIFEPFYSTKAKGMGVGLFVVKKVVEENFRGQLSLTSGKNGTTFVVKLPLKTS